MPGRNNTDQSSRVPSAAAGPRAERLSTARQAQWPHGSWIAGPGVPGDRRQPGLGFAAAQALVADGARVLLSAPHETTAVAATARLSQGAPPGAAAWAVADNADPATPGQLIAAARDRFGRLDGALISVGGSPGGTVAATDDDAWRSAFESVFLGAIRLARALAASLAGTRNDGGLTATGGSIAFVLAASVLAPLPGLAISNGLFPGLAGVVKTLADEHGPTGIRINGLLPENALGGDRYYAGSLGVSQVPAMVLRRSRKVTSRQRPWWFPMRRRVPTTRNPASS
ncbi:MAG: SDR family oxidoreductase [Streptosporangiaceae bacterium]